MVSRPQTPTEMKKSLAINHPNRASFWFSFLQGRFLKFQGFRSHLFPTLATDTPQPLVAGSHTDWFFVARLLVRQSGARRFVFLSPLRRLSRTESSSISDPAALHSSRVARKPVACVAWGQGKLSTRPFPEIVDSSSPTGLRHRGERAGGPRKPVLSAGEQPLTTS